MSMTKETALQSLKDNDLLKDCDEQQVRVFFESGRPVKASEGTVFIHENKPNKHIFMVLKGELDVFLPDSEERFSMVHLAKREPGHYVGEYSMLDPNPASASVMTTVDSILFQISHEDLVHLFKDYPLLGQLVYRNMLVNMVTRLRESDQELDLLQPFT